MSRSCTEADPSAKEGSSLCLACGLCCSGVLHTHAVVAPEEIDHVRSLGLAVEPFGEALGFPLPCPMLEGRRCTIYGERRPRTCGRYQCDLLKRYLSGAIAVDQALPIIRRARELFAEAIAALPPGCSFDQARRDIGQRWDSGEGVGGSGEARRANARFLIAATDLEIHARAHFGKNR